MATREQVEKLKRDWLADPCYDLFGIEGFEEYDEETRMPLTDSDEYKQAFEAMYRVFRRKGENVPAYDRLQELRRLRANAEEMIRVLETQIQVETIRPD